jgi:hypothetical protein
VATAASGSLVIGSLSREADAQEPSPPRSSMRAVIEAWGADSEQAQRRRALAADIAAAARFMLLLRA